MTWVCAHSRTARSGISREPAETGEPVFGAGWLFRVVDAGKQAVLLHRAQRSVPLALLRSFEVSLPTTQLHLEHGPPRFTALAAKIQGVTPKVLTAGPRRVPSARRTAYRPARRGDHRRGGATAARRALVGRTGTVADVTDAVLWLPRAEFLTGETVHLEGGRR